MNVLQVTGNLGSDPRIGQTKNGAEIMSFSVADNQFVRGESRTQWWDVITTNPQIIKTFRSSLKKGSFVQVTGSAWTDKEVLNDGREFFRRTITLYDIHYVNGGTKHGEGETVAAPAASAPANSPEPAVDEKAYDIPMGNAPTQDGGDVDSDLPF